MKLHQIKTDKFKTVYIRVDFRRKIKKDEITKRNILADMLNRGTKKYKTEREMVIQSEELYNANYGYNVCSSGNYSIMSFSITTLSDKYTEEGNLEKVIAFLMEMIFHPNVNNKSFEEQTLNISKNYIRKYIEDIYDSPKRYARNRIREIMSPSSPFSYHQDGYIEDLEKIDGNNLYEYYLNVLKNDTVDIYVIGEYENIDIINKYFKETKEKVLNHIIEHKKYRTNLKKVIETKKVRQSTFALGCKIEPMDAYEMQYVASIYSFILGGSPDSKLFQNVREKSSLCYSIASTIAPVTNSMFVYAGIDKKNYNKTLKEVLKQIESMKNGEFTEQEIENAKTTFKSSIKELYDSEISLVSSMASVEYLKYDTLEERIKKIDKVTKEEIIELAKKIKPDSVYLIKGVLDEKN